MLDAFAQRPPELLDQFLHLSLGCGREVARDIFLADQFADRGIDQLDTALPAWPVFKLTTQLPAAELELRVDEAFGQERRRLIRDAEGLPCLQRIERGFRKDRCELGEGGQLASDNAASFAHLSGDEIRRPGKTGRVSLEL